MPLTNETRNESSKSSLFPPLWISRSCPLSLERLPEAEDQPCPTMELKAAVREMASPQTVSSQKLRRHPGRRPGGTATQRHPPLYVSIALPHPATDEKPTGPSRRPGPHSSRIRGSFYVARNAPSLPTPQSSRLSRRERPRGPALPPTPPNLRRVRAARLPLQASAWPPSCRHQLLRLRTAALLAGRGNRTSRAAGLPLAPSRLSPWPGAAAGYSPAVAAAVLTEPGVTWSTTKAPWL